MRPHRPPNRHPASGWLGGQRPHPLRAIRCRQSAVSNTTYGGRRHLHPTLPSAERIGTIYPAWRVECNGGRDGCILVRPDGRGWGCCSSSHRTPEHGDEEAAAIPLDDVVGGSDVRSGSDGGCFAGNKEAGMVFGVVGGGES